MISQSYASRERVSSEIVSFIGIWWAFFGVRCLVLLGANMRLLWSQFHFGRQHMATHINTFTLQSAIQCIYTIRDDMDWTFDADTCKERAHLAMRCDAALGSSWCSRSTTIFHPGWFSLRSLNRVPPNGWFWHLSKTSFSVLRSVGWSLRSHVKYVPKTTEML